MGNVEILKRGDLQMTSAGTGIRHSEHQHGPKPVHFIQIWSVPSTRALPPRYTTRHFTDEEKKDRWVHIVSPAGTPGVSNEREAQGPAPVHSALHLRATILSPGARLAHTLPDAPGARKAYAHVIQRSGYNPKAATGASVKLTGEGTDTVLREGDGAYISGESGKQLVVENVGDIAAEILLFDLDV